MNDLDRIMQKLESLLLAVATLTEQSAPDNEPPAAVQPNDRCGKCGAKGTHTASNGDWLCFACWDDYDGVKMNKFKTLGRGKESPITSDVHNVEPEGLRTDKESRPRFPPNGLQCEASDQCDGTPMINLEGIHLCALCYDKHVRTCKIDGHTLDELKERKAKKTQGGGHARAKAPTEIKVDWCFKTRVAGHLKPQLDAAWDEFIAQVETITTKR